MTICALSEWGDNTAARLHFFIRPTVGVRVRSSAQVVCFEMVREYQKQTLDPGVSVQPIAAGVYDE